MTVASRASAWTAPSFGARGLMVWLAVTAGGCCAAPRPPLPLGPTLEPSVAIERLIARRDGVQGFRGKVSLELSVDGESVSTDAGLVVRRPGSIRLDTLSLLGPTLMVAIDGLHFTAYASPERRYFVGTIGTDARLPSLMLPPLPAEALVDAILASPLSTVAGQTVERGPDDGTYRAQSPTVDGGMLTVVLDARTSAPRSSEVSDSEGILRYRVRWEGAERPVPRSIVIELPSRSFQLTISTSDPEMDPALAPGLFRLAPPRGATVVDLDAPDGLDTMDPPPTP